MNQLLFMNVGSHACNDCSLGSEIQVKWPLEFKSLSEAELSTKPRWGNRNDKRLEVHKKPQEPPQLTVVQEIPDLAIAVSPLIVSPIVVPISLVSEAPKGISEKTRLKKIEKIKKDKSMSSSVKRDLLAELGA